MVVEATQKDDDDDPQGTMVVGAGGEILRISAVHVGAETVIGELEPESRVFPQDPSRPQSAPPTVAGLPSNEDPNATARLDSAGSDSPTAHTSALPTDQATPMTRVFADGNKSFAPEPRSDAFWDTVETSGLFQPGQLIFNRYIVQRKLGGGGMGDVWLVTHKELNTDRALKVIVSRISFDSQARVRFKREAQAMAAFHHPNAVVVHDARLTDQDVAYIDMEYVEGRALSDVLRKGEPMPLAWIARVLDQLCDALSEAHAKGIVHRDLKPANLMLLDGREPGREQLKVLDFGIAKIMKEGENTESSPMTQTGVFLGTPFYASPEQADGHADTRSDIYAVGVLLCEFLTGYRPFTGPAARVLVDVMTKLPPPFATLNPSVECPMGIEGLVMRCLSKKPEDRPQTVRELADAFRSLLPEEARAPLKPPPPPPLPIRLIAAAVLLTALLAGGLAWMLRPSPKLSNEISKSLLPAGFTAAPKAELDEFHRPSILAATGEAEPLGLRMVVLRGKKFAMGNPLEATHEETVHDFAISDCEVTNGQMHTYFKARGIKAPQDFEKAVDDLRKLVGRDEAEKHPAVRIPREHAVEFAKWAGGELPTSTQWEFAARSTGLLDRFYVWPDSIPPKFALKTNSGKTNIDTMQDRDAPTAPVRTFGEDKTDQGVFDMMGNVREWCRDPGPGKGTFVVRGGSFRTFASDYSNFARTPLKGDEIQPDLGFRVVVDLPLPPVSK